MGVRVRPPFALGVGSRHAQARAAEHGAPPPHPPAPSVAARLVGTKIKIKVKSNQIHV